MKAAGIVREVDSLGRIVIPVELRTTMRIHKGDPFEIFVDDDKIVLKKYYFGCLFCDNTEELINFKGKDICMSCLKEAKEDTGDQL